MRLAAKTGDIMKRIGTMLLVAAVIAALLAVPLGVAAATDDGDDSQQATPGEQLGGVVGVQAAAVDGELDDRTFGQQLANADSDEARADLIDARLNEIERRIGDHENRATELRERREGGEISEGRYRAQLARLEAEQANTERTVERANDTARGLPAGVLENRSINTDRIDELRRNASQLGGPETGEAARGIAGENVTAPMAGDWPDRDRGAGDRGATDDRPGSDRSALSTNSDAENNDNRGDEQEPAGSDTDQERESIEGDTDDTAHDDDSSQGDSDERESDRETGGSNADQRTGR